MSAWWTPNTKTTEELNTIALFHFGNNYLKEMEIIGLKPFEYVKWNCIKATDQWVGTIISFKLVTGDKETLLILYHDILGLVQQLNVDKATLLTFQHVDWNEYSLMFTEYSYTWGQFPPNLKVSE